MPEKRYKENLQIIQQKTIAKQIILRYKLILLVDRWPSGRRRTIGNRVYPQRVPWVRIPLYPPFRIKPTSWWVLL